MIVIWRLLRYTCIDILIFIKIRYAKWISDLAMDKIFSQRLKARRKQRGLSQSALAQEIGVTDAAINMLEKGRRLPSYEILISLADYFGVSIDYLVGRSDVPNIFSADDIILLSPEDQELLSLNAREQYCIKSYSAKSDDEV